MRFANVVPLMRAGLPLVFVLGAVVGLAACATGGEGSSDGPRRDANLITNEELAEYTTLTAHDVIRRLRPRWLRARGGGAPQLIMDGARLGSLEGLSSISVADVETLRFLSASDATMRFGTNFPNGAIEVVSRAR